MKKKTKRAAPAKASPPKKPAPPEPPAVPALNIPIFPPPDGPGRPPKPITRDVIERMCRVLRLAGTVEQAALAAGISQAHFSAWQRQAREAVGRGEGGENLEFLAAIQAAKQARGLALELQVVTHAKKDPPTARWMLERLPETRERWKPPKVTILVEEELTHALDVLEAEFKNEPEILDRIYGALASANRGAAEDAPPDEGDGGADPADGEAVHAAPPES